MKLRTTFRPVLAMGLLLSLVASGLAQSTCTPGWRGQLLIDGETPNNWTVEADNGSSGTITTVGGFIGNAVQLNWNIGAGNWVQAKHTFSQPIDLSQKDIFGLSLRGSAGVSNRISLMFADVNGVFFGADCDGGNVIPIWMKNLAWPKKMFYHFFTIPPDPGRTQIDWTQINRFFIVVKRIQPGAGGGTGQLAIDHLQADRAADWRRQGRFAAIQPDNAAMAKAVQYILSQQKNNGLFVSWQEERPPLSHLYDQALVLIVLTREGQWSPANEAAEKAKRLADFLVSAQKDDGHWARTWNAETGAELGDDRWVGDQAWWIMALAEYAKKSGDQAAFASAQRGADWLIPQIDSNGKVVPSTEGTVDVWWAMISTRHFDEADRIQNYLLTKVWDTDLKYWWRGRDNNDNPDPVVAMDCATWVGEFAKTERVNRPDMTLAALGFVQHTLVTTDSSGALCGFDGMGPVSVWCEGTAQYISAGGQDAPKFLAVLLSLQNQKTGGMPGSPDSLAGSCFGWLSKWTGISSTAWLYFALTRTPFPTELATTVAEKVTSFPKQFVLNQNYPNPFSSGAGTPSTRIEYFLPKAERVSLKVYDLAGREVVTLVNQLQVAGWHSVAFAGAGLASGIYFYIFQANDFALTKKLLLFKKL